MTEPVRVLTGITTTGIPHLGNYCGAIRPTVRASRRAGTEGYYFLADYHALIKCDDPATIQRSTLEIAASWIASGLDPETVTFYRQSDIPEIPELTWFLTCVTGKGLLNRAHAYKAMLDKNAASGAEPDDGVSAGLFMYPVLMAADILMFRAHQVPVGRDQVQHIEMARDMASSFNHLYGGGQELLTLPEVVLEESVATLPGLDGRKMSKSYGNTIPLFAPRAELKRLIAGIVTDSRAPGEAKSTEGSAIFQIYQAFASPEETAAFAQAYADGIGWGDAKIKLYERIDHEIAPMRERYEALMAEPARVESILRAGAEKARPKSRALMQTLRDAVGLRSLARAASGGAQGKAAATDKSAAPPVVKQYREKDGLFYVKLADARGETLLHSSGFASGREAGEALARLKREGAAALSALAGRFERAAGVEEARVTQALARLGED
jgi:tryptophanyl-tRNA synthetase